MRPVVWSLPRELLSSLHLLTWLTTCSDTRCWPQWWSTLSARFAGCTVRSWCRRETPSACAHAPLSVTQRPVCWFHGLVPRSKAASADQNSGEDTHNRREAKQQRFRTHLVWGSRLFPASFLALKFVKGSKDNVHLADQPGPRGLPREQCHVPLSGQEVKGSSDADVQASLQTLPRSLDTAPLSPRRNALWIRSVIAPHRSPSRPKAQFTFGRLGN